MSNIDWDSVAREADRSPRALLAEFLSDADSIETLVIVANKWAGDGDEWKYKTSGSAIKAEGMMRMALRALAQHNDHDVEPA